MYKLNVVISLLVAALASNAIAAADLGTPPACILACINEQEQELGHKIGDLASICPEPKAQQCLEKRCEKGEYSTASDYFQKTCESNGYKVAVADKTTSKAPTASSSSSAAPQASASDAPSSATRIGAPVALLAAIAGFALI
ncbi:hypothetical protein FPQ18DRAFT_158631 [Pyronema domesticum]|uniref:CFEM domain-containing protein n=1 Tax=Pyronema omphalodes (strain CBS 100304) TaxID=1076935 RepID=U4L3U6_PYROM|nr:hypothetical protein FPQ18DRAFT_158631 [Pyronema domesticum]CCX06978.1 Protein of unknown function [Pyronema omphalodes CBS 100304]